MGNYEIIRDSIDQSIKDSFKMADTDNFTKSARTVYHQIVPLDMIT